MDINISSQIVVKTAAQWSLDATVYSQLRILVTSDEVWTGTDQRKFKIANGVDTWANLDYPPIGSVGDNIYNSDGSLPENRNFTLGAFTLTIADDPNSPTFGLIVGDVNGAGNGVANIGDIVYLQGSDIVDAISDNGIVSARMFVSANTSQAELRFTDVSTDSILSLVPNIASIYNDDGTNQWGYYADSNLDLSNIFVLNKAGGYDTSTITAKLESIYGNVLSDPLNVNSSKAGWFADASEMKIFWNADTMMAGGTSIVLDADGISLFILGDRCGLINDGDANTILGVQAGGGITIGANNVLIGHSAAPSLTSGTENTIVGYASGGVDSGTNNVIVGSNSGVGATNNNSVVVGAYAAGMEESIALGSGAVAADFTFAINPNVTTIDFSLASIISLAAITDFDLSAIPSYDDDAAAGLAGLATGKIYTTTGAGAAPLNVAGIFVRKQ